MNNVLKVLCLVLIFLNIGHSQQIGSCGTTAEENLIIRDRMMKNRQEASPLGQRTGVIKYIPISYFLSAKNDGSSRLRYINVLINVCAINELYKDQDVSFYLKGGGSGIIDVNNTFIYDDPSATFGSAAIQQLQNKNRNAVNIYVASKANGASPGVLAFYNPQGDYIVADQNYVKANGTTLAHEIGHFFSLAHTFFGWESDTYDCNTPTPTEHFLNGQKVLVEYVDRAKTTATGKLHCLEAADGFCDTQADYNFGFGWNGGCTWSSACAKDPDENQPMDPDEANMMSYFLNCLKNFSGEQKKAIADDYSTSNRNFLKTPVHIPLAAVTEAPKNARVESTGFNAVTLKWDAPANATHYILEIATITLSNNATFKNFILKRTDTTFTDLVKGTKYAWRVTAFNPTNPCPMSTSNLFFVNSNFGVATKDINNTLSDIQIYNTNIGTYNLELDAAEASKMQFELFSIDGKLIHSEKLSLITGKNIISRNLTKSGAFTYRLYNETNSFAGKFFAY